MPLLHELLQLRVENLLHRLSRLKTADNLYEITYIRNKYICKQRSECNSASTNHIDGGSIAIERFCVLNHQLEILGKVISPHVLLSKDREKLGKKHQINPRTSLEPNMHACQAWPSKTNKRRTLFLILLSISYKEMGVLIKLK